MKALSIQVQPGRFAAIDVPGIEARFKKIAEDGWDDYLLLYHFDNAVNRDAL